MLGNKDENERTLTSTSLLVPGQSIPLLLFQLLYLLAMLSNAQWMWNRDLQSVYNSLLCSFLLALFLQSSVGPSHGLQSFRMNLLLHGLSIVSSFLQ